MSREKLERETGIEPATNGLGSRYSTIELLPLCKQSISQNFYRQCDRPSHRGRTQVEFTIREVLGSVVGSSERLNADTRLIGACPNRRVPYL
jgi:hypothetical protein